MTDASNPPYHRRLLGCVYIIPSMGVVIISVKAYKAAERGESPSPFHSSTYNSVLLSLPSLSHTNSLNYRALSSRSRTHADLLTAAAAKVIKTLIMTFPSLPRGELSLVNSTCCHVEQFLLLYFYKL